MKRRYKGSTKNPCDCADTICPEHYGEHCRRKCRTKRLWRVDMEGGPVNFCPTCREDAERSGLYTDEPPR
jgi:hypothetical protein